MFPQLLKVLTDVIARPISITDQSCLWGKSYMTDLINFYDEMNVMVEEGRTGYLLSGL